MSRGSEKTKRNEKFKAYLSSTFNLPFTSFSKGMTRWRNACLYATAVGLLQWDTYVLLTSGYREKWKEQANGIRETWWIWIEAAHMI